MTQVAAVEIVCHLVDAYGPFVSCRDVAEWVGVPVEEAAPALSRAHANGKLRRVQCLDDDGRTVWGWEPTDSGRDWLAYVQERDEHERV